MKPFIPVFFAISLFTLSGCVSLSKYNSVVLANATQRASILKLNKKIKDLQFQNQYLRDSLNIFKTTSTSSAPANSKTASTKPTKTQNTKNVNKESGVEYSNDSFQTSTEKDVLYFMNYARMKPQEFLKKYVLPNLRDTTGYYERTLIETLRKMKPVPPLKASKKMFNLAYCHASESGKLGYVGHDRKNGCSKGYNAECCAYGSASYSSNEALNYVLQLLVDEGVPSLGHREIILLEWLKGAGVSIQPHKSYGENVVIDFSGSN